MGVWTKPIEHMRDAGRVLSRPRQADAVVRFGALLKAERNRQGLTQWQLGEQATFTASYINDMEQGRRKAPIATVLRLANALGVDADPMIEAMIRESEPEMMAWHKRQLAAEWRTEW